MNNGDNSDLGDDYWEWLILVAVLGLFEMQTSNAVIFLSLQR